MEDDSIHIDWGEHDFGSSRFLIQLVKDKLGISLEEDEDYARLLEDLRGIIVGLLIDDEVYELADELEDDEVLIEESIAITQALSPLDDEIIASILIETNILDEVMAQFGFQLQVE